MSEGRTMYCCISDKNWGDEYDYDFLHASNKATRALFRRSLTNLFVLTSAAAGQEYSKVCIF